MPRTLKREITFSSPATVALKTHQDLQPPVELKRLMSNIQRASTATPLLLLCLLLITNLVLTISVKAQNPTATLSGIVTDQNGAVVPGVNVAVINIDQGFQRKFTADAEGSFVVPLLPAGTYTVKAEHEGFAPAEIRDVILNVNDRVRLTIQLNIGSIGQTVDVREHVSLINESTAVETLVDRQFVENLPLNGRSFQSLIELTPGMVFTKTTSSNPGQFSVNGQRADANYFTIDGVSANIGVMSNLTFGQSAGGTVPGLSATGGSNNLVSVDALQEFKVMTSTYAPEFGRTPGAQVSVVTRSGTKEFHGTVFEYFRNDALDANDWFANATRQPKPRQRQNDFGGVIGGPVLLPRFGEGGHEPWYDGRRGTFFFFSYEGLRLRQPQVATIQVPSLNSRQTAPVQIQPYLNVFPIPNGRDLGNGMAELNASFSNPITLDATSVRLDHIFNQKLSTFGRYNYSPSTAIQRSTRNLSTLNISAFKTETLTLGSTLALSAAVSNDLRFNYSRNRGAGLFGLDNFAGAVPLPDSALFPAFASSRDAQFGFSLGTPRFNVGKNVDNLQQQINLVETMSVLAGSHSLRFGIDYRRLSPTFDQGTYAQTATFNGIAGALSGRSSSVIVQANAKPRFPLITNLSAFSQDTWAVNPRLSITYGVRWELNTPPSEKNGNDPFTVIGLDNPPTATLGPRGRLFQTNYKNFAPRFGLAFYLRDAPGQETILRGGVGTFFDLGGSGGAVDAFGNVFPYTTRKILAGASFPLTPAEAEPLPFTVTPVGQAISVIEPNLGVPRTYQWNLAVQQSLGTSQTLSLAYVAALGRRLIIRDFLFQANPSFLFINITKALATSDYHALEAQFQRRLTGGLQALASYTWSHSLDNVSDPNSFSLPVNKLNLNQERGPSDFDVRHSFTAALTYNLPEPDKRLAASFIVRDWALDGTFRTRTATPVNVITGIDTLNLSFVGSSVLRPDLISGVPLYLADSTVGGGRRINSEAFVVPANRQGTLGRNALRGFAIWELNLALRKEFSLTERFKVQFRVEAFNLFNHPNFADPDGRLFNSATVRNAQFGRSPSMLGRSLGGLNALYQIGGPRSIQFALKLRF